MTSTLQSLSLKDKLLSEFELQRSSLLLDNTLLDNFRNASAKAFHQAGFPTKKDEEYKYLRFDKILTDNLTTPFSIDTADEQSFTSDDSLIPDGAHKVVIINGFYSESLTQAGDLPEGVIIKSLADAVRTNDKHAIAVLGTLAKSDSDPFIALNSALFMDGVFIFIPKGIALDSSIHISQFITGNQAIFAQPRILLVCEENSQVEIIHHIRSEQGNNASVSNTVIEADLEKGAHVNYISVQEETDSNSHIITTQAHVYEHAEFKHVSVSLAGKLIRNNLNIVLEEPNCEGYLFGYYHPGNDQVIDNHTLVDHRKPHCNSNELYKGVIDGNGVAVFNGKVHVQQDAQKTNAFQSNKNILLSENGSVNTKPQLEIYADDVKCSHGSSTGVLDPDQVFYLRSRGLSVEKAKALLLSAYAGEVLEEISNEKISEALTARIEKLINA